MKQVVERQRAFFARGETRQPSFRIGALKKLAAGMRAAEKDIFEALKKDLGKHQFESYISDVGIVYDEIEHMIDGIPKWSRPTRVRTPITIWPSSSHIYPEPVGNVLVISPWNYPINLALIPMIGAIAAGNTVVLKTSEMAPASAALLKDLIERLFDPGFCAVVEGGVPETTELLKERFDHIFFTGSTPVGRVIMRAAAEHLTPVTLELGGKSPCIVDSSADLDISARRIVWGKFFNAGQTCIAPDYILVEKAVKAPLLAKMKHHLDAFYGQDPNKSDDFARIINQRHFDRLTALMTEGKIVAGGQTDRNALYIAPTIIDEVEPQHKVMDDEIFGPLLPVLTYETLSEAIAFVKSRPKPLAAYLFSNRSQDKARFLEEVPFGGGCINNALVHFANANLTFGGVGDSGMGSYHGKGSFDVFTHRKAVMKTPFLFEIPLRFPRYKGKLPFLRMFIGRKRLA